jgi:serine/threonine protein kinase
LQYAPIEVLKSGLGFERSRSQDVFSLGCCFIEIFVVYKGKHLSEVDNILKGGTAVVSPYAYHIPEVLGWMKRYLIEERCDIQLWNLIRLMVAKERKERLPAYEVWEEAVIITSDSKENLHFCGGCCMPMMSTRLSPPTKRPSSLQYVQHFAGKGMVANKDANLTTVYQPDEDVPYIWKRNLRIVNQAILDAVDMRAVGPWLCRKTIWPKDETEYEQQRAFEAARAEARLLELLHTPEQHRHIVRLAGTYRQGRNSVLLLEPVAELDLKSYLSRVGQPASPPYRGHNIASVLRKAFGCLASAVNHMHTHNIVHGDIWTRNILMTPTDPSSVCLAEFSYAVTEQVQRMLLHTYHSPYADSLQHMSTVR